MIFGAADFRVQRHDIHLPTLARRAARGGRDRAEPGAAEARGSADKREARKLPSQWGEHHADHRARHHAEGGVAALTSPATSVAGSSSSAASWSAGNLPEMPGASEIVLSAGALVCPS